MKNPIFFILVLSTFALQSQNIEDVLRLSTDNLQGTARFQGLSGAFTALGGDLSALNSNPASSAVFNNSQFSFTGTNYNRNNDALYFGEFRNGGLNSFKINQIGGVFVFKDYSGASDWKKFTLGLNYDLSTNFRNRFYVAGPSNQGIDNYFVAFAQGVPLNQLLVGENQFIEDAYLEIGSQLGFGPQQAFLGYQSGVIDPVDGDDPNNSSYFGNALYDRVNQDYYLETSGYNSKFTLNFATQYLDVLYIGGSMNFHSIYYEEYSQFSERGYNTNSPIQFTNFDNLLVTRGNGFSFSLGMIAKLNQAVRIGASYQSPVWYNNLTDDLAQRINSDFPDKNPDITFIDFTIVNLFPRYSIQTPGKFNGGLALVFGANGLLSFDYSYQDMSKALLKPTTDPAFSSVNSEIASTLRAVSTFRVGGEYRIKRLSLRGGYRFEQSPFVDGFTIGDLNGFSAGLGYNFGGSRFDVTYSRAERAAEKQLFDVGVTTPARINSVLNNIGLSYTLNF